MRRRTDTKKKLTYRYNKGLTVGKSEYSGDREWKEEEKKRWRLRQCWTRWCLTRWWVRNSGGRRLRRLEDVRPDRDTEKRVAPSEEEEAGLPWGRRFPRSRASRRGASSPTSLTPIPVHWPVGEKKGKVYLFALVLRCRVAVGCWRSSA